MKDQKRFAALALSAIMVVSMAGNVYAAKEIKSKDDLAGATIGVQLGTTGDLDASDYEKDGSTVERYSKGSEAVQALKAGQIDCVIIDSQPAQKFVENNDDLKILDEPFEEEEYAICLKKGNDELLEKINGALEELKKDGTIDSIMDKQKSYAAFMTLFWTGMRLGELLALTPADIDFENKTISISKSYQRLDGKDVITLPKTPKSKRTITVPDFLLADLKDYMNSIYCLEDTDRLFQVTKYFMEHEMQRGIKNSGVKRIRIHDIRHSHCALLFEMGITPLEVADRLGHERVETTMNIYAHIYPNKQRALSDKLEKVYREDLQ